MISVTDENYTFKPPRFHFILGVILIFIDGCTVDPANTNKPQPLAYDDLHRPQFHFSPAANWMNDPNGMVYYAGEYHLFFQYYPDSTVWGPMHWGHAVSKDLVHWEELPIALYPDSLGYIFSGSAVVDSRNTSGFGVGGVPPMIAIFTHHNPIGADAGDDDFQYQSIAYSIDKGRSWTKYEGNPVVPNPGIRDFRDPKVIWDNERSQWVMVLAAQDHVKFYSSKDLKQWSHLSDFGKDAGSHAGVWECPDLFPLADPNSGETVWVLLLSINPGGPNGGSATQYFIGQFNGTEFELGKGFMSSDEPETAVWLDYGRDNYAGVTWSDIPSDDGRRIFIGWMSNWDYAQEVPTLKWRSAMTLPRELSLTEVEVATGSAYRLRSTPISELSTLRSEPIQFRHEEINTNQLLYETEAGGPVMVEIQLNPTFESDFRLTLLNSLDEKLHVGYNSNAHNYYVDRSKAGPNTFSAKFATPVSRAPSMPGLVSSDENRVRIFFDASSLEVFAENGLTLLTETFYPTEPFNQVILSSDAAAVHEAIVVYPLRRIWGVLR